MPRRSQLSGSVQAEELLKVGQQTVIIDPTGAWYGLKSSADGQRPGFPIPIFGGEHADVPLPVFRRGKDEEASQFAAGETLAAAIVENRLSAILDVSLLRTEAMKRFVTGFLEELYHRNREPLHLFVDEADLFAPQKLNKGNQRMLGAMDDIVRRGRIRGIGCTLITQRSQVLNKDVLTQAGILVALRLSHPQDIEPIHSWAAVHGDDARLEQMKRSLPSLPNGVAWVWAPSINLFEKVHIRKRETFNSSKTPEAGKIIRRPKTLAAVDLASLGEKIASVVKEAQENDPVALRARVQSLNAELTTTKQRVETLLQQIAEASAEEPVEVPVEVRVPVEVKVPVLEDGALECLTGVSEQLQRVAEQITASIGEARGMASSSQAQLAEIRRAQVQPVAAHQHHAPRSSVLPQTTTVRSLAAAGAVPPTSPTKEEGLDGRLPSGVTAVLSAVAQYPSGVTKKQLTVLTSYTRRTRDAYLQKLRNQGFVYEQGGRVMATAEGIAALGSSYQRLPTGKALQQHWLNRLPQGERSILTCLVEVYPKSMPRAALDGATGYTRRTRDAYLQKLGARMLVTSSNGEVRASDELFGS